MNHFPNPPVQQLASECPTQSNATLPTTHDFRGSNCEICKRETTEPHTPFYSAAKERVCSIGSLPPDAMQIYGQFTLCRPTSAPFEGWFDESWYDVLLPIEELVYFIERYDFPAWHFHENAEGHVMATATHLGLACESYLPQIAHVCRYTLPQEGRSYTDRFYAFIEACEETRRAGYTFFDSPLQDCLSRSLLFQAQNVLVDTIRTKMRLSTASSVVEDTQAVTPALGMVLGPARP